MNSKEERLRLNSKCLRSSNKWRLNKLSKPRRTRKALNNSKLRTMRTKKRFLSLPLKLKTRNLRRPPLKPRPKLKHRLKLKQRLKLKPKMMLTRKPRPRLRKNKRKKQRRKPLKQRNKN